MKYSVSIDGRKTSVSLEPRYLEHLKHIAHTRSISIKALIREIAVQRGTRGLSSAARLFVLKHLEDSDSVAALSRLRKR